MSEDTAIFWFRRDLRLADNPGLSQALTHDRVVLVYIADGDTESGHFEIGAASKVWLRKSLAKLNKALSGRLAFLQGDPLQIIPQLVRELGASNVYWNRCYEPSQIRRDTELKAQLKQQNIAVTSYNASLLWEPWQISKRDGTPYQVFTPYFKKGCLQASPELKPRPPIAAPPLKAIEKCALLPDDLLAGQVDDVNQLLPSSGLTWEQQVLSHWQVGESAAQHRLNEFLTDRLLGYKEARDVPATPATSRLSPHLHFGEISPHHIWHDVCSQYDIDEHPSVYHFLSELGWREFSHYLLYHWPGLPDHEFNQKLAGIPWQGTARELAAWQQGRTGIPIVDAGMRELWQTGTMHNRVRMIVASLLVKNLLVDWREGAKWFQDCLFDADLAANSQNWQWVAGTGADAAPYFRVFNPVLQGEKFDPEGEYVKRFCPELSALPKKFIHCPWKAKGEMLAAANVELGVDYPVPIVDLKVSRERALSVYKGVADQARAALK